MTDAFFAFVGLTNSMKAGDVDAAMCDAAALRPMGLSVLKCLYVHLSEDATKGELSREEIADIVAVAGGMIELSGAVAEFVEQAKGDGL